MPTIRGITIRLQSQFEALKIPERIPCVNTHYEDDSAPVSKNTVRTEIPCYPGSRFWIIYSCPPTVPAHQHNSSVETTALPLRHESLRDVDGQQVKYYYFKVYIHGIQEAIVSWGIGADQDWQGGVGHGFFNAGKDFRGKRVVEKKGLFFPVWEESSSVRRGLATEHNHAFEVKVFRAKGRIRDTAGLPRSPYSTSSAVSMRSVGLSKGRERKHLYTYALLDALDEPHAVFQYSIEPWWQPGGTFLHSEDGTSTSGIEQSGPVESAMVLGEVDESAPLLRDRSFGGTSETSLGTVSPLSE